MNSRGRPILAAMLIALGIHTHGAWAQPTGGQIVAGTGAITQSGSATVINQTSARLAANWTNFSINTGESVRFNQPSASSIALNRVLGQDPSVIMGSLSSNGQVFLLNPNGVLFGRSAQVDVGGLVASTLRLSDQDFLAGRYTLTGNDSTQSVVNQGSLTAANGGYIALIAPQVGNEGTISAPGGAVALAAGNQVTLTLGDHQLVGLTVDQGAMNALATNKNLIHADGGLVILTAQGQDAVLSGVVNNEGIIQARTVSNVNGVIKLLAGMEHDTVQVSGTLDASAPNGGDGGFIETSAAHVKMAPEATVTSNAPYGKTGNWLIDPTDYTIAASGGDITGAALATNLGSSNVTIQTASAGGGNGDIFVNDAISWSSANSLTMNAHRNVNVNAAITNAGSGGVTLRADSQGACVTNTATCGTVNFSGGNKITVTGGPVDIYYNPAGSHTASPSYATPVDYTSNVVLNGGSVLTTHMLVNDVTQLQAMTTNLTGDYALGRDIDASATSSWNGGLGFLPVGNTSTSFTGSMNGGGHSVSGLVINRPGQEAVGLFGQANFNSNGLTKIGMIGGSVTGQSYVGSLVGYIPAPTGAGPISDVYAEGTAVTGSIFSAGGLIGDSRGGVTITRSYATGNVRGGIFTGGLIGYAESTVITKSFATGNVSCPTNGTGGLVGWASAGTQLTDVYATGSVFGGNAYSGGLVGYNNSVITNSYSSGYVSGASSVGGLVGFDAGGSTVVNSYWNTQTSGQATSVGGTGQTTAQMMQQATFGGWDFSSTWGIVNGTSYPYIKPIFTGGIQVVSGTVAGVSNTAVPVVVNGTKLVTTTTGADGFYYATLPANTIPNGTALLTYLDDNTGTFLGANLRESNGGHSTGMDLTTNTLRASGGAASMAGLVAAKSALSDTDIPYTYSGNNATTSSGVSFVTDSGTNFSLNGILTANDISLGGPLTLTADSTLIPLTNPLALTAGASGAYTLTLNTTGNVTQGAAINVTGLNLQGAGGNYALNTQNNDVTRLSGNTGTVSFRDDNGFDVTGLTTSGTTTLSSTGSVTQSGAISALNLNLQGAGGNYQLTNTTNNVPTLAANTGTVNFINNGSLIIWTVGGTNGITATGPVTVETRGAGSNLILNQTVSSSSGGNAIVLATPNDFFNIFFSGPGALSAPNGRWLVYMNSYASSVEGGLTGAAGSTLPRLYNRSYAAYPPGTISEPGNHLIYQQQPMLSVTANNDTRTYGASDPVFSYVTSGGYVTDDGYTDTSAGYVGALSTVATSASNVGGYAITRGTLGSGAGYAISFTGSTLTITPQALSVTANNANKIYDSLAYSGNNGVTYNGFANGENSSVLGGTLAYGGSAQGAVNVGTYTISPSGLTSSNYAIAFNDGTLTVSAVNPPPPPIVPPNPAPEPGDNPGTDPSQAKDKAADTSRDKEKSTDAKREKDKSTDTSRAKTKLKIQIVNGGIRLPREF